MAAAEMQVRKPTEQEKQMMQEEPTWSKEVSKFDWSYDEQEMCLIVKGLAEVTCKETGQVITFKSGDLVIFPPNINVVWNIKEDLVKHYLFG